MSPLFKCTVTLKSRKGLQKWGLIDEEDKKRYQKVRLTKRADAISISDIENLKIQAINSEFFLQFAKIFNEKY